MLKCADGFKGARLWGMGARAAACAFAGLFMLAGCKAVGVSYGGEDKTLMVKTFALNSLDLNENAVSSAPNENGEIQIVIPYHWDISRLGGVFILEPDIRIEPNPEDDPDYQAERVFTAYNLDGEREEYRVIVKRFSPSEKEIKAFQFSGIDHEPAVIELATDSEGTITVNVPYDTDTSALAAEIEFAGASLSPEPNELKDYTAATPVEFVVTAGDSSTRTYTIAVNKLSNTEAKIKSFKIGEAVGQIDHEASPRTIHITLPYGTPLGPHTPELTVSAGADWEPKTAQSFGSSVDYTVTAADGVTESVYRVIPNVAQSNENKITSFAVSTTNPALAQVLPLMPAATINDSQGTVVVTIPKGMSKTFTPVITHQGVSVTPASGVSKDFTNAQTYTVKAANDSTKNYSVTAAYHGGIAASLVDVQSNSTASGTATTLLYLTFDKAVPTLTADNLLLTTESGETITKGALSATGNPNVWNLAVSNASKNRLSVTVKKNSDPVGYTLTANKTVLAYCAKYDIYYVPNGGAGEAQSFLASPGATHTIKPGNLFTAAPGSGSEFVTWSGNPDGSGAIFAPNTTITVNGNISLCAIWRNILDEPASGQENNPDLMVKFGVKFPNYSYSSITPVDVAMTFIAAHKYITMLNPASAQSKIAIGDYIDLRALTVAKSAINKGAFTRTAASADPQLRLIVVGRNFFNGKHGNIAVNHLVFQFKEPPSTHPYESSAARKRYVESALRNYLLDQYIDGLQSAGVPLYNENIAHAPVRRTWKAAGGTTEYDQYTDKLWLPLAKEMKNNTAWSNSFELDSNAALGGGVATFDYYLTNPLMGKNCWTGTPSGGSASYNLTAYVAFVESYNNFDVKSVETDWGLAPAFCIKQAVP